MEVTFGIPSSFPEATALQLYTSTLQQHGSKARNKTVAIAQINMMGKAVSPEV